MDIEELPKRGTECRYVYKREMSQWLWLTTNIFFWLHKYMLSVLSVLSVLSSSLKRSSVLVKTLKKLKTLERFERFKRFKRFKGKRAHISGIYYLKRKYKNCIILETFQKERLEKIN